MELQPKARTYELLRLALCAGALLLLFPAMRSMPWVLLVAVVAWGSAWAIMRLKLESKEDEKSL